MPVRFHVAVRNARLDAIETTIGASPTLELRTGPRPANITDADTGTLLASMTLPADWMAAASAGSKALAGGPWTDTSANAAGTFGHYRLKTSGGVCYEDGTVSGPGGGGDIVMDSATVAAGQEVRIVSKTLTDGNA
jgi:hypothetical protein